MICIKRRLGGPGEKRGVAEICNFEIIFVFEADSTGDFFLSLICDINNRIEWTEFHKVKISCFIN